MAICPAGHTSTADDFCDNCGLLISAPPPAQQPAGPWAAGPARQDGFGPGDLPAGASGAGASGSGCPNCATPRTGRFCEGCGLDYNSGKLPGGGPPLSPPTVFAPRAGSSTAGSSAAGSSAAGSSAAGQAWQAPSPSAWQESSGPVQPSPSAWQESSGRVQPSSSAWQESSGPVQSPAPAWGSSGPQPAPDPFDLYDPSQRADGLPGQQSPGQQAPGPLEVHPPTQLAGSPYAQPSSAPQSSAQPAQPHWGAAAAPQAPFGQQPGLDPQYQSGAAQSSAYPGTASPPAWTPGLAGGSWSAVVSADRTYYDIVRASGAGAQGIDFPVYVAERRFSLVGAQMRIGRHSASRGLYPEIDLTGPPTDPGISRLHAVLIARPDGGWAVLDPGSANGTMVNGTEIPANQQVPLRDGDRINLGAWTAITVQYA
jgi:FHA domain